MSTTSAAHHERNRALSHGVRPGIITPGVDLNDGLVFPANSSSSTPTTVSDYVETLRAQHAIIVRKVKTHWAPNLHQSKIRQKHKDRRIFPDGSFVLLSYPGHSPTNKIIHTEDGTTKSYHMKVRNTN
jgi:hypothetical protein